MKFWVYYDPVADELILAPAPPEMGWVRQADMFEYFYVGEL